MPDVHLLIGPVGAGKSTYARQLAAAHRALRFDLDDWMVVLFRPDRPQESEALVGWYVERAARCVEQIWRVAQDALETGTPVVLEIGLVRRAERHAFYARLDDAGMSSTVHLIDAPRDVRRARVTRRNETRDQAFSMVVPPAVFELASDLWEPPDDAELVSRDIRCVDTAFTAP